MSDYQRIAQAIEFITQQAHNQPPLEEIAAHVKLSPFHFHKLFCRWAGVTPKRFLQVLTVQRAKALLAESKPLLEVSDTLGLSSSSRLQDHFTQLEAVTPGQYKTGGEDLTIQYATHPTPFGNAWVATTPRGICRLAFIEDNDEPNAPLAAMQKTWSHATFHFNPSATQAAAQHFFEVDPDAARPLSLHLCGTNFQVQVWKALLSIPPGTLTSYNQIATAIARPTASRAVGTAIGANPVALLIPCHRVIHQSGKLGGYHWGLTRKHAIHAWESARYGQ